MDVLEPTNRSKESTKYDEVKYGSRVNWSKKGLLINGRPVVIVSAEFHYFRVPDVKRWPRILRQIRGLGFNAIRLYFHWGYHSPENGKYIFEGARDVSYLLRLCEELHLYVIAAPGPYICAETALGGYPTWLVAKRELRIRHLKHHFIKRFDEKFADFEKQWIEEIITVIKKHERTTNPEGCVILLQIENELLQKVPGISFSCDEEMRCLAVAARDAGSTLPIFHNDDSPHGSWSTGAPNRYWKNLLLASSTSYRTDIYGVDLYFIFAPTDARADASSLAIGPFQFGGFAAFLEFFCVGGLGLGGDQLDCIKCLFSHEEDPAGPPAEGWKPSAFAGKIDNLERTFNKLGGAAADSPVVLAETQVGWINQWARERNYDQLYEFFGEFFSSTLQASLAGQGLSVINHYIVYGGTNYGCSGDSEVYTSYDYSGFLREFGMLSGRGREFRQKSLFHRSFNYYGIAETEKVVDHRKMACSVSKLVVTTRRAIRGDGGDSVKPMFIFLRNFVGPQSPTPRTVPLPKLRFTVAFDGIALPCELAYRDAVILPANIPLSDRLKLSLSSLPVIVRGKYAGAELWVIRLSSKPFGRIVFHAEANVGAVEACWASVDGRESGSITASKTDENADSAQWIAPLEELSQAELEAHTMKTRSEASIAFEAFTEPSGAHGFTLSVVEPCVIALKDPTDGKVLCRFLAITEEDAQKFTAQLDSSSEQYSETQSSPFACAWGANEIAILPNGTLDVASAEEDAAVYFLGESGKNLGESFSRAPPLVSSVIPDLFCRHKLSWVADVCPEGRDHLVSLDPWTKRCIDWTRDVSWTPIDYTTQRDPLDHHFTSGCTTYRCTFQTTGRPRVCLTLNLRHIGMVYCNGKAVGGQFCYSHNAISAGAMHAADFTWAGKKVVDLTPYVSGEDYTNELVIVVHSLGQSRQPFLLNDIRNRRGILSAVLSRSAKNVQWYIFGIPVSSLSDPFNTGGLPLELEATCDVLPTEKGGQWDAVISKSPFLFKVSAGDGVQYFRSHFSSPKNGYRLPYDLKFHTTSSVLVMAWVNQVLISRYLSDFGPQSDFYVPEGLLHDNPEKKNTLTLAIMPLEDLTLQVTLSPWIVDPVSGNLRLDGKPYVLKTDVYGS